MEKINKKLIYVDFSLALLFVIYFFYVFFQTTSNIPINDDYSVLENFTDMVNADSFFEKTKLFFKQHNEHRIFYDKLWFFIDFFAILPGFLDLVGLGSGSVIFYLRLLR